MRPYSPLYLVLGLPTALKRAGELLEVRMLMQSPSDPRASPKLSPRRSTWATTRPERQSVMRGLSMASRGFEHRRGVGAKRAVEFRSAVSGSFLKCIEAMLDTSG